MRKKILYSIFIIFVLAIISGATNSLGATLTEAEAQELLDKIPNEMVLTIKETQFESADKEISQQIKQIVGEDVSYFNYIYQYRGYTYNAEEIDIRKSKVLISIDEKTYVEKDIKITYSNSQNYNETDRLFVEDTIEGLSFDRKWEYEIYSDGTSGEYHDKSDFSWNKLLGTDEISIIEDYAFPDGDDFSYTKKYLLYLFKNDILYKVVEASKQDVGRIVVSDEIEETDEAYANYAKPIIEKIACPIEEWDDGNGTVYRYVPSVKKIDRIYDDFIGFKITCELKSFVNNEVISQEEYYRTVLIAKANEYICKLVPVLQDIEIINKGNKEYIKGTMKITEKDFGFDTSIDEAYPPKVVLIDNNGNRYETSVTRSENDIYYFETELDKLGLGKIYVVQACSTDPNNRYPSNNINATMEKDKSIDVSNDSVSIKSIIEDDCVKLNIREIGSEVNNLGDINLDGDINARDAKLAIQHFTGKIVLTADQIARGDVYGDGEINARDAKLIIQFFTGKISSF